WFVEAARGIASRFTFDPHNNLYPVWSPDGTRVAFGSDREAGQFNLYTKLSNGAASEELLLKSGIGVQAAPYSWSPDGAYIVFRDWCIRQPRDLDVQFRICFGVLARRANTVGRSPQPISLLGHVKR